LFKDILYKKVYLLASGKRCPTLRC